MKLWFDHTKRCFTGPDIDRVDTLVLSEVEFWTERKITPTCPQGVVVGFLEGKLSSEEFKLSTAWVVKPRPEGWYIGRPLRRIIWASKVLISGSRVLIEDVKEIE